MTDLFGGVAISLHDVELWLDNLPNFDRTTSSSRREQYAKFYDLASIIAKAKLNGSFSVLEKQQSDFLERLQVSRYKTQYVKTQAEIDTIALAPCPAIFHVCDVLTCAVYQKEKRRKRNRRYYMNKTHGAKMRLL